MRKLASLATALTVAASVTVTAVRAQEINFGILSTEASSTQKKSWEPYLEAMTKATGLKINGFYASDYAGVIEAMRFNKVQVAWLGNKSAMEAVDRSGAEVFTQTVGKDGSRGYYAHILVNSDSAFTKLDDILKCDETLDFGIGDPNSTSGFLVQTSYVFAARNIDPKSCFRTVRNGSHQANAMAVANKQVNAGTNNSEDLQRLQKNSPEDFKKVRVNWTSPIIPLDPITWRKDLDPAAKARLYTFLLSYGRVGTPEEIKEAREVLGNLVWSPMVPSNDNQLLPIRTLEANRSVMKINADDKLSAEQKAAQLPPLNAEIARLQAATAKAETAPFQAQLAAFVEADKAGDQVKLRKMIGEFVARAVNTPTH